MGEAPTGTVTLLFTDIEQSTKLLDELGAQQYADALNAHRELLRTAFARHDGYEVDTQGDAFFYSFEAACAAVQAAIDAQLALAAYSWPAGRSLQVRMGLHTTDVTATGGGYVGLGVHRAARIAASAPGGQIVVSTVTRDMLAEHCPDIELRDLGLYRLKDLAEQQRIFQVVDDRLRADFPPLRATGAASTTLPQQSRLIGREQDVAALVALLRGGGHRIVTLVGPGGAGKTSLAIEAANAVADLFRDGAYFVGLGAIHSSHLVVPAIGEALGIDETAGQSLTAFLPDKELLLVLDNFEQVVDATPAITDLLTHAPGVRLLVTSRIALRAMDERVYAVSPLPAQDAISLFVERATSASPTFEPSADDLAVIERIAIRLDGLPLAIELAAARVRLLTPEAILNRLDDRFALLASGTRDQPDRQQTLRSTLDWSHDLLGDDEQRLFAQLGIFSGSFTVEQAEELCDANLDALTSLIDHSLLQRTGDRLVMLETIREYAAQRLAASPESDERRTRHARHFLQVAETAYTERFQSEDSWLKKLSDEYDNMRGALEWLAAHDAKGHAELASALGWFWHTRSHFAEGRAQLSAALQRRVDDARTRARALTALGTLAAWQGDLGTAQPALEEAISLWRASDEPIEEAVASESLAWALFFVGRNSDARAAAENALRLQQGTGNECQINRARLTVCQVLVAEHDVQTASDLSMDALRVAEEHDDAWALHLAHHYLADCALIGEDYDVAARRYLEALKAAVALGNRGETAIEVQGFAMALAGLGRAREAQRLDAAAETEYAALGVDITGIEFWAALRRRALQQIGTTDDGVESTRPDIDQAVADALAVTL